MPTTFRAPTLPLTHRWTALYEDGSTFRQPDDDAPKVPRPDGTGSAYGDVDQARVVAFFLESGNDEPPESPLHVPKHLYSVDLRDGHFEVDGVALELEPVEDSRGPRRLLFFRRVAHNKRSAVDTGQVLGRAIRRRYILGWEVDALDRRIHKVVAVQRTIMVGHEVFTVT